MAWTQSQRKPHEGGPSAVAGAELATTLERLGVQKGGVLLVHASMSALGFVLHGVEAVLGALRAALGEQGTLLVPTFTGALTDPACWVAPALPASLLDEAKSAMPAFDPERTLPHRMGSLALRVLFDPHSRRSHHPLASFAALGPRAGELVAEHDLVDPFGPKTPLGRARAGGAQVLLLGVDQRKNAALMHAHCLAGVPQVTERKGPFLTVCEGQRRWVTPERFVECTEGYARIEDELVTRGLVRVARVGDGTARLMDMGSVVDLAQHLIRLRPERVSCRRPSCRQCSG
jgi:aminoglycoside 3-N-acetyltransferase